VFADDLGGTVVRGKEGGGFWLWVSNLNSRGVHTASCTPPPSLFDTIMLIACVLYLQVAGFLDVMWPS